MTAVHPAEPANAQIKGAIKIAAAGIDPELRRIILSVVDEEFQWVTPLAAINRVQGQQPPASKRELPWSFENIRYAMDIMWQNGDLAAVEVEAESEADNDIEGTLVVGTPARVEAHMVDGIPRVIVFSAQVRMTPEETSEVRQAARQRRIAARAARTAAARAVTAQRATRQHRRRSTWEPAL